MTNETSVEKAPSVGALLRASRLRCGEDLHQVARVLYIRYSYLNSIEEGRPQDLPGPTYAVGFVRTYAEHLGLDAEEVVRRFKAETSGLNEANKELVFPSPLPEGGVPGGAVLFIGVVIASLAYGGWYLGTTRERFDFDLIPKMPERLASLFQGGSKAEPGDGASLVDTVTQEELREVAEAGKAAAVAEAAQRTAGVAPEVKPAETPVSEPLPVQATPAETPVPPPAMVESAPRSEPGSTPGVDRRTSGPAVSPSVGPAMAVLPPTPAVPPPITNSPASEPVAQEPIASGAPAAEPVPSAPPPAPVARAETPPPPPAPAIEPPPIERAAPGRQAADRPATQEIAAVPPPPAAPEISGEQSTAAAEEEVEEEESFVAPSGDPQTAEATPGEPVGRPVDASRIVVRAKDAASWIQIRDDVAKQLLLTRLLRPGESYQVPDRPGLKLLTGNAGALEVLVDGKAVPPIGPVGAVRRDVALEVDRLLSGSASDN